MREAFFLVYLYFPYFTFLFSCIGIYRLVWSGIAHTKLLNTIHSHTKFDHLLFKILLSKPKPV